MMTLSGAVELVRLQRRNKELVAELQRKVEDQERVVRLFQKYVPRDIVEEALTLGPDHRVLEGESRIVSVLLSDIRDFTAMGARMDPKDVVSFLNSYFAAMTACVKRHSGTVNKFIGDGILAIFGAPVSYIENRQNAVLAAIEMVEELKEINAAYEEQLGGTVQIGIGINTGEVIVGNIGSEDRIEYTVIGDTVNVASRIERLTKGHADAIFISRSTHDGVKDLALTKPLGAFEVRGKAEAIDLFEVIGRRPAAPA